MSKLFALGLLAPALSGPAAAAATGGCHAVSGTFVATSPATCAGVFCTEGTLSGDWNALYSFAGYGFAADGGMLGHSTITLANGTAITTDDERHLFGPPLPGTTFATHVNVVGTATREFAHATGWLVAPGVITTIGTYAGEYCLGIGAAR